MNHQFRKGAVVTLRSDCSDLGLNLGSQGIIWCLYQSEPPAYEVTFQDKEGHAFDLTLCEEEISAPLRLGETEP